MITPYIVFDKRCEEALIFYERVFEGKNKEVLRYNDYIPEAKHTLPKDISNYILHAKMEIYDTVFTFADELSQSIMEGSNIYLTINPSSLKEGKRVYNALKDGGEVILPPTETFYSPLHTTLKDKFGVLWNIIVLKD
jgi:PhnB protein